MAAGYGRGYYGTEQLARAPKRGGFPWVPALIAVAVGGAAWFLWPRKRDQEEAEPSQPTNTQEHGFTSQREYENAVVRDARELQATGATVTLAPHLQHLEPLLRQGTLPEPQR